MRHASREMRDLPMRFSVYVPPLAEGTEGTKGAAAPVLYYLAGLSCNGGDVHDQGRGAAASRLKLGILMLVAPGHEPP